MMATRVQACLLAARHGAGALLAGRRGVPAVVEPTALWTRLAAELPAFAEWASYFALLEGQHRWSERQVDDLLRDLGVFLELVDQQLGRSAVRVGHG
ncbi:MAG: SAV_6107 family HEPN domain-containing protein [Brooklawnia sp.]|uniref:SAV_6107 family HEPN domain-containing protein n=1 Tax=Brooklawnia sp. TaxID=2699740 RepID=UPI003C73B965